MEVGFDSHLSLRERVGLNMNIEQFFDEPPRYKKKSKSKSPSKSKHKHQYQDCLFEMDWQELDKDKGFVPTTKLVFGVYCPDCGNIGSIESWCGGKSKWWKHDKVNGSIHPTYSDEALKELNENTRTLPLFRIKDFTQKFVDIIG